MTYDPSNGDSDLYDPDDGEPAQRKGRGKSRTSQVRAFFERREQAADAVEEALARVDLLADFDIAEQVDEAVKKHTLSEDEIQTAVKKGLAAFFHSDECRELMGALLAEAISKLSLVHTQVRLAKPRG